MKHLTCSVVLFFYCCLSFSQVPSESSVVNRVDLEDVKIKGEANKNSVSFTRRSKHDLNDRIKLRRDFNKEILENLPPEMAEEK